MRYIIEVRSQKSVGSSTSKWGGPDTYVAVQVVPDGVEPLKTLHASVAAKRGIEVIYCGEGYREHAGPRSSLGRALAKARHLVEAAGAVALFRQSSTGQIGACAYPASQEVQS